MNILAVLLAGIIVLLVLIFLQAPGFFVLLLLVVVYVGYRIYAAVRRTWREFNEGLYPDQDNY